MTATFNGKILMIGLGAVARCTLPLLLKHVEFPHQNLTVMDYADVGTAPDEVRRAGATFVADRVTRENLPTLLGKYVGPGDMIIDLAWNISCTELLEWCHANQVLYVNTSVELWDPYSDAATQWPVERTLYVRHMEIQRMLQRWGNNNGATAVLEHGANPGLVSHFTKQALDDLADKWLDDHKTRGERRDRIAAARQQGKYNDLAHQLNVQVIHISERDTQVGSQPKQVNEFVNTWSIEGFYEEGVAPAEMGWGTHERRLPALAHVHRYGPGHQICLAQPGVQTWVRSWVPAGEIVGMVVRHGEASSIALHLEVRDDAGRPVYRPTVHYAYCPCDAAINSLHELQMRNYEMQPKLRIMTDEIVDGRDELGCLLMGHDYKSWWIGSLLDIHEARQLVPHQNATTLQVAASVLGAVQWMIENPRRGVCVPDDLPHDFILKHARPYLGPFVSQPVDWTPLQNWRKSFDQFGVAPPPEEDMWQFTTFQARGAN